MANGRASRQIKRIRNEVLVALKMLYPAPLLAEQLRNRRSVGRRGQLHLSQRSGGPAPTQVVGELIEG